MFRKHGRTAIRCAVQLRHEEVGSFEVVTRNISASGIFIGAQPPSSMEILPLLKVGDKLEAHLESIDNSAEKLNLQVTRIAADGVGLIFL